LARNTSRAFFNTNTRQPHPVTSAMVNHLSAGFRLRQGKMGAKVELNVAFVLDGP